LGEEPYIRTGTEETTTRLPTFDQMYTYAVDALHQLKKLTEEGEKLSGSALPIENNPSKIVWLSLGWSRKSEQFLNYGTVFDTESGIKF